MKLHFSPSVHLEGSVALPASKSISNRVLIINALCEKKGIIENLAICDDTTVLSNALTLESATIDIGAAGTAMRFLTAFCAIQSGTWILTGSERMKNRPIKILVDALTHIGAKITYLEKEGFPPLQIVGTHLKGGKLSLDGSVSSQYVSALMMIAPKLEEGLTIELTNNISSEPYIRMTRQIMAAFGVKSEFCNQTIDIRPQPYKSVAFDVESDWSAASYWYELLAIHGAGKLQLPGLKKESAQGDSKLMELFQLFGIKTTFTDEMAEIEISPNKPERLEYDFSNEPDIVQTLAVTCCMTQTRFHFKGLSSLKIKETNRVAALINELAKCGFELTEPAENELAWNGSMKQPAEPISIATYEDHRMAMAFAQIEKKMPITIEYPEVVSKSYPDFWKELLRFNNIQNLS